MSDNPESQRTMKQRMSQPFANALTVVKKGDIQHGKPLRILTGRQAILPTAVVSILFFKWGLMYGLLDTMNFHVRLVMHIEREDTALMAATYYSMYLFGTILFSGPLVRACGYRLTFVAGLTMLGLGCFAVSGAAQHFSFPGMVVGMAIVGLGVSTLERGANPYAVNIGPRDQSALRILLAQGCAGAGTVVAPLMAKELLFEDPNHPAKTPMDSILGLYRGVGTTTLGLAFLSAILFFRTWVVPEAPQHSSPKHVCGWKLWKHPLCSMKYSRLWWAAGANFINMGCQVTFAQFFIDHMVENGYVDVDNGANNMAIAQGAFVIGRYIAAALVAKPKILKPRYVLCVYILGAIVSTLAGAFVKGAAAITFAILVMFFEAPSFPMIFESADAELGEWSSTGETIMIVSICGGGLQPALFGTLSKTAGVQKSWILTAVCFALVWTYCLATNLIPSFRKALDTVEGKGNNVERDGEAAGGNEMERISGSDSADNAAALSPVETS